jgi:hypothetical protein
MSFSDSLESVKSRMMQDAKALKLEHCRNHFEPMEVCNDYPLSLTLGDPFASDLSDMLKSGGQDALKAVIGELLHEPGKNATPNWQEVQNLLRYRVWPILVMVWVEAEARVPTCSGNWHG